MAVYKPSNCIPFMDALDLTKPQDISCELNTSNMNIVGYKLKVLDSQNTVIFEGSKFTPLNDKSIRNYNNTGVNGTVLTLPLIVTDESLMNENTILFKGVETANDANSLYRDYEIPKEDGVNVLPDKLSAINNSLYYRWYTRVTYDDVSREVYDEATANGGLYYLYATYAVDENAEPYKKTYEQAVANEYYYCENYIEISPKPEFSVAWHRFYYIDSTNGLTLVDNENDYNSASQVYAREQLFDSKKKSSTSWNIAKSGQNNFYSLEQYHYEQNKGDFALEKYYTLNEKGVPELLKDKTTFASATAVYIKITDINYNYDVVNDYLYYKKLDQTGYNDLVGDDAIVYVPRYIFIGDIEPSVYYSSVLNVYNKEYNFVNAIESGAQVPNYISVVENGNYYVSPNFGKFKLITDIPFGYKVMMNDTGSSNRYLYTLRGNGGVEFDKSGKLISGFYKNIKKEIITGFYNGAPNQPYKWQISLAQGEYDTTPDKLGSKWYDMTITTGKVIGSTADRIQGLYSEEIYKDYYIQLNTAPYDVDASPGSVADFMVGTRMRISSYDHTFGYVYPVEGSFPEKVMTDGIGGKIPEYFSIYKWPNDPEVVAAGRKVDYATTQTVNQKIGEHAIKQNFALESGSNVYCTQIYEGKVEEKNININLYDAQAKDGAWAINATTLLICKEMDGSNYSPLNGVYKMVSLDYKEADNATTIRWQRTAEADTIADMLGRVYYIQYGSSAGINYENDLGANATINSSPIQFKIEKPVEIYLEPADDNADYYAKSYRDIKNRKHFSPIFKTTKDQIFIRPFVGVNAGMRFTYKNNAGYFNIEKMDNKIWCITPPEKKFSETTALKPGDDYTVTSYFKVSDENPFYGYNTPTIDLIIKNSTGSFDSSGAEIVSDRRLKVDAIYSQLQNITWKNYRWTLYNNTDGYVVSQTDTIYTGGFENEFAGLENGSYYTITLEVETEAGDYLSVSKQVLVKVGVVHNIKLQSAFDCGLQAIKFSFIREGIITPTPQISDSLLYGEGKDGEDQTQFMRITDKIEDRNYGVKYNSILLSSMIQEDLQGPTDNSITINSQHILGNYFEGDIMDVIVGISEQEGRKMRQRITIDAGYDTKNDNGYYIENPDRNRMFVNVYTEAYEGGGWNVKSIKGPIPVEFYNENGEDPYITDVENGLYMWRKKKTVLLAYNADGTAKDDYDYLVISGPDSKDRNLRYLLPPTYEYNVFQSTLNEEKYDGKSVLNPLTTSSTAGEMQAVWIDNQVTPHKQIDSDDDSYVGVLHLDEPTVWADKNSDNSSDLHWQDLKDYSFQKQVYVNENQNHSGRQDFATRCFTFNITVDNLDPMISRNEMQISAKCFVKEIEDVWQKDAVVYINGNRHKAKLNGDVLMIYP